MPFAAETVVPQGTPGAAVTATLTVTPTAVVTTTAELTLNADPERHGDPDRDHGPDSHPDPYTGGHRHARCGRRTRGQGGGVSPLVIAAAIVALGVLGYEGWRMWIARLPARPR